MDRDNLRKNDRAEVDIPNVPGLNRTTATVEVDGLSSPLYVIRLPWMILVDAKP
jgi:hypothetical protein